MNFSITILKTHSKRIPEIHPRGTSISRTLLSIFPKNIGVLHQLRIALTGFEKPLARTPRQSHYLKYDKVPVSLLIIDPAPAFGFLYSHWFIQF